MRTTVTLDDDVAAKLKAEARRSGRPFKQTLNAALRRGLVRPATSDDSPPFRVRARDLGGLREGLSLDSASRLLDEIEGPLHR
jgi:Ribbon-helix-helix protein, copG family